MCVPTPPPQSLGEEETLKDAQLLFSVAFHEIIRQVITTLRPPFKQRAMCAEDCVVVATTRVCALPSIDGRYAGRGCRTTRVPLTPSHIDTTPQVSVHCLERGYLMGKIWWSEMELFQRVLQMRATEQQKLREERAARAIEREAFLAQIAELQAEVEALLMRLAHGPARGSSPSPSSRASSRPASRRTGLVTSRPGSRHEGTVARGVRVAEPVAMTLKLNVKPTAT